MRDACLSCVLSLALALPAMAADYAAGLAAYDRGDVATARRDLSVLADAGQVAAQYSLAMLYLKSDPPDYARAKPWLEESARQGLPESQYMLGLLSVYGVGMPRDAKQGSRWLQSASAQGHEDATALLATLAGQSDEARQDHARLRDGAREQREAEQARKLRTEIQRAKATEQALKNELARSQAREKTLVTQRQSLQKASASNEQVAERMRRERDQLQAELVAMRSRLADKERDLDAVEQRGAAPKLPDEPTGEIVISGRILEILPEGILLTEVSRRRSGHGEFVPEEFVVFVNLLATNGLRHDQEVAFVAEPTAPYRYKDDSGATGPVRAYRATGTWSSN